MNEVPDQDDLFVETLHTDYGVRRAKGVTWVRQGREFALEHIRDLAVVGIRGELVSRLRSDWRDV